MPNEWLRDVRPGCGLVARGRAPLYPQSTWTRTIDEEETWVIALPTLRPGDGCVVIDVLDHESDRSSFAALMVTPMGVGCALLLTEHFEKV